MDFLGLAVGVALLSVVVVVAYRNWKRRTEIPEQARRVVVLAAIDLSNRLKIALDPKVIRVVEVKRVNWPDTSLGCPEPGQFYAQVITPGFVIRLEAGGKLCEYHSDYTRIVFVGCKTTH